MPVNPRFAAFPVEQKKLTELLAAVPGGYVVEIGAYLGCTTRVLAEACIAHNKGLVVVDSWDGTQDASGEDIYRQFRENTSDLGRVLTIIREKSQDTRLFHGVPGNIALVFVDGDHSYRGCYDDLVKFWDLLAPGGVLAVHDMFCPGWDVGIANAVHDFATKRSPIICEHLVYYPTQLEVDAYGHGRTGLTWFHKPKT